MIGFAMEDRHRAVLTGTGAVLIAAGFLAGVYFPSLARREQADRELAIAHQAIRNLPERAGKVQEIRRQIEEAERYLAAPGTGRDPGLRTSEIIDWTASQAKASGVRLLRLAPSGSPTAGTAARRIELVCEGRTAEVAALLYRLETESRRVSVDGVLLVPTEGLVRGTIRATLHAGPENFSGLAKFDASAAPLTADSSP